MKKLRLLLSLLLTTVAISSVSACTSITAWDDDCDIPGSNSAPGQCD